MLFARFAFDEKLKVMFGSRYSAPRILNLAPQAKRDWIVILLVRREKLEAA